ncbi:MAG: DUF2851 family protein [Verrucomicrobiota bacterium]
MKTVPAQFSGPSPAAGSAVAETQGLYGPFTFSERLLQFIWARHEFAGAVAQTADGRPLEILDPGKWNGLGGPDFLGSRLRLDGAEVTGDVELHLYASDWVAHAHARDAAYANVRLHAVLFPPQEIYTAGANGRAIPVLVLLPLLPRGLEEYAEDEAVAALAGRPFARVPAALAALGPEALAVLLAQHAERRWQQKVHFARQRLARLGWENACHHAALEILGHRFNRAPMLKLAAQFPLADWRAGRMDLAEAWATQEGRWQFRGVRPLNHPRLRLRQYAAWAMARPDWPARLRALASVLPRPAVTGVGATRTLRREHRLPALRQQLSGGLCADAIGGSRLDTLVCDGLLPLLAAETEASLGGLWQIWFPGDQPESLLPALRTLGLLAAPARPACHGAAQGLLGWLLETGRR